MSVRLEGDVIFLEGQCHVEQAEQLLLRLQEDPSRRVELSGCRHLHSAVAQVLLSHPVQVCGDPADPFLRQFVAPCFATPEIST
ncbi:hypothetical protein [Roseateles sp.]|uniref:hypothetical protein n=1 Tax=Roseateles sp. TaxID=1971397 RepID=UPI002F08A3FA